MGRREKANGGRGNGIIPLIKLLDKDIKLFKFIIYTYLQQATQTLGDKTSIVCVFVCRCVMGERVMRCRACAGLCGVLRGVGWCCAFTAQSAFMRLMRCTTLCH